MKDEFVNLISHELRTPLSSILGYLELVIDDEDNPLSPEQLTYLGTVERNANRLLRLVSDLLLPRRSNPDVSTCRRSPSSCARCCPRRSTPPPRSPPDVVSRAGWPSARTRSPSAGTRCASVRPWTTSAPDAPADRFAGRRAADRRVLLQVNAGSASGQ